MFSRYRGVQWFDELAFLLLLCARERSLSWFDASILSIV